jgi:hypothetical protein
MNKPNILVLTTSTSNTAAFIGSLQCLDLYNVSPLPYDRKWHEQAGMAIQQNPDFLKALQNRQAHIPRERCAMDDQMLMEAKIGKPDAIVYISAWQEDYVPLNETLGELNSIAPLIHFLCDGADFPWWPQLKEFERRGTFSLTVNIDGSHYWPGGKDWPDVGVTAREPDGSETLLPKISNAMTLLTPVDVSKFPHTGVAYTERPYAIGYGGNNGGHMRSVIVQRMQRVPGFAFKQRDVNPETYQGYADFLSHCRVSVNVPFTGTGLHRHVKGRVLETGFAGACLLEWENEATRAWFSPRNEFFEYNTIDGCADIAEWLSNHPRIAEETARALNERVVRDHHPCVFWSKVLGAVMK